jgi:hypothetical protein
MTGGTGLVKAQGLLLFYSNNANDQLRVDHVHFNSTTYTGGAGSSGAWTGRINGCFTGVIDHNVFDNASPSDPGSVVQGFMASNTCNDTSGWGDGSWAFATGFGTSNFIFQEDNIFNGGLEGDCDVAGKFVSRYNTLNGNSQASSWIHTHGTQANGGRVRGCRAYEAYHDYFNVAGSGSALFGADGGPSLIWGNTVNHATARFSDFGNERNDGQHHQGATPGDWGFCGASTIDPNTGSANGVGSAWDGTTSGNGYPCFDGTGRGQGIQVLNGANFPGALNSTTGTIAFTQEYLEPSYQFMIQWNNRNRLWPYCVSSISLHGGTRWDVWDQPDRLLRCCLLRNRCERGQWRVVCLHFHEYLDEHLQTLHLSAPACRRRGGRRSESAVWPNRNGPLV